MQPAINEKVSKPIAYHTIRRKEIEDKQAANASRSTRNDYRQSETLRHTLFLSRSPHH